MKVKIRDPRGRVVLLATVEVPQPGIMRVKKVASRNRSLKVEFKRWLKLAHRDTPYHVVEHIEAFEPELFHINVEGVPDVLGSQFYAPPGART